MFKPKVHDQGSYKLVKKKKKIIMRQTAPMSYADITSGADGASDSLHLDGTAFVT